MKFVSLLLVVSGVVVGCCEKKPGPMEEVLGTVNGRKVTFGDIQEIAAQDLEQHHQELYQIKKKAFEIYSQKQVIAKAAKKEGSTPDEYFDFFRDYQPKDITDAEKAKFEKQMGILISSLPKQRQDEVHQEIKENRLVIARNKLVGELLRRNRVQFTLLPPGSTEESPDAERRK